MLLNIFKDKPANEDYHTVHLLGLVLEWLLFCIEHHNYHIKICIINKDLLRQILVLMKSPHTFLVLGAIRFLRYKRRHNLLVVAVLELFKFVKPCTRTLWSTLTADVQDDQKQERPSAGAAQGDAKGRRCPGQCSLDPAR